MSDINDVMKTVISVGRGELISRLDFSATAEWAASKFGGFQADATRKALGRLMLMKKWNADTYQTKIMSAIVLALNKGNNISSASISKLQNPQKVNALIKEMGLSKVGPLSPTKIMLTNPLHAYAAVHMGLYKQPVSVEKNPGIQNLDPGLMFSGGSVLCLDESEFTLWLTWAHLFNEIINTKKPDKRQAEADVDRFAQISFDNRLDTHKIPLDEIDSARKIVLGLMKSKKKDIAAGLEKADIEFVKAKSGPTYSSTETPSSSFSYAEQLKEVQKPD